MTLCARAASVVLASPLLLVIACSDGSAAMGADDGPQGGVDLAAPRAVPGCQRRGQKTGQAYVAITSSVGEARRFYLSVPAGYDPTRAYPVVFGIHGRDYDGVRMRDYLALETPPADWALFVYPDALRRTFGNDTAVGWENGPVPSKYAGGRDVAFFRDTVAWLRENYCVDEGHLFATGQSWGGDFSNICGCILGDLFNAIVPVAANGDYYLPRSGTTPSTCSGGPKPFWGMHGKRDPSLALNPLGYQYRDYWLAQNGCDKANPTRLTIAGASADDECWSYPGCAQPTRWCSYNSASGHQVPRAYYARETVAFFQGLLPPRP